MQSAALKPGFIRLFKGSVLNNQEHKRSKPSEEIIQNNIYSSNKIDNTNKQTNNFYTEEKR